MAWGLAPEAVTAGYRLVAFRTIGSTSDEAAQRARAGEGGPVWIVSDHQTAGRGRRGAGWATPPGNLAASLLLTTDRAPAEIATLGFVAGVALARALDETCARPLPLAGEGDLAERVRMAGVGASVATVPCHRLRQGEEERRFRLKWPNDVLADGAKLAGILLGTESLGGGRQAVVVGIGVNARHAPDGLPYPAASLAGIGFDVSAPGLFRALSRAWVEAYAAWAEPGGFEAVRRDWLERAAGIGGEVAVHSGEKVVRGRFETLDRHGHLVLRGADGSARTVSAGEVHFGAAATARPEPRA